MARAGGAASLRDRRRLRRHAGSHLVRHVLVWLRRPRAVPAHVLGLRAHDVARRLPGEPADAHLARRRQRHDRLLWTRRDAPRDRPGVLRRARPPTGADGGERAVPTRAGGGSTAHPRGSGGVSGALTVIDATGPLGQLGQLLPVGAVPLHVGFGQVPAGHRVVEAWRAVPGPADPRYLVPVDLAAARRVLVSHLRLREPRVRLQRRAAAAAVAPLAAWYRDRGVLTVSVPQDLGDDLVDELFVTRHLVRLVPGATGTALSLRGGHARAKPTVQLVDDTGAVLAFAKVASDPAT